MLFRSLWGCRAGDRGAGHPRGVAPAILGLLAGQSLMSLVSADRTGDDAYAEAIRLLLE